MSVPCVTYNPWKEEPSTLLRFDLQLFAAEDEGRTEEPTEKKIREARDKGQVAKSQELAPAMVVIAGMLVTFAFSPMIYSSLAAMTSFFLGNFASLDMTPRSLANLFFGVTGEVAKILAPVFIATMIAAVVANVIQVGWLFTAHPLKPDLNRMKFDPATIMKKVLFSKQVAMNLFKSVFKVAVVGVAAYLIISHDFYKIMRTPDIAVSAALEIILITGLKIIIWSSVLLLILSVPDYIFQRMEHRESLKMRKEELKEELKETMGDPQLKARLREMQREMAMKNMVQEVPRADVVVTNPTHFAVALRYDRETMVAPEVVARGMDNIALKIREIARENSVPIIENRPLAREMYQTLEVGDQIPEDLFYAVSLVYAELYRRREYREAI
jgi:flagellar biosynthetic protein FlhB